MVRCSLTRIDVAGLTSCLQLNVPLTKSAPCIKFMLSVITYVTLSISCLRVLIVPLIQQGITPAGCLSLSIRVAVQTMSVRDCYTVFTETEKLGNQAVTDCKARCN